jgi:hypothetical protein
MGRYVIARAKLDLDRDGDPVDIVSVWITGKDVAELGDWLMKIGGAIGS